MTNLYDANTFFGVNPTRAVDWSLSTLVALLEEHGVAHALTLSLRGRHYDAVEGNDETLAAARAHPVLVPVATVDPRRYLGCLDEVARCADLGCVACRFFPDHHGWPLEWLPFLEIAGAVARRGLPIILPADPPGTITLAGRLLAPLGLRVLFLGASYGMMAEVLAALKVYPGFYYDTHLLDTPRALEALCRAGGEDRVVFGSGVPERDFECPRNMLAAAELSPAQRVAIAHDNLRAFLGEERAIWV